MRWGATMRRTASIASLGSMSRLLEATAQVTASTVWLGSTLMWQEVMQHQTASTVGLGSTLMWQGVMQHLTALTALLELSGPERSATVPELRRWATALAVFPGSTPVLDRLAKIAASCALLGGTQKWQLVELWQTAYIAIRVEPVRNQELHRLTSALCAFLAAIKISLARKNASLALPVHTCHILELCLLGWTTDQTTWQMRSFALVVRSDDTSRHLLPPCSRHAFAVALGHMHILERSNATTAQQERLLYPARQDEPKIRQMKCAAQSTGMLFAQDWNNRKTKINSYSGLQQ
jgi:hypothetical protein